MATRRARFRTKLCRNFALGHCPQGEKCNYIHASPESIQTNNVIPMVQPSVSKRSIDDQLSSTTFSPPSWPTLSPVTNASSDHYSYHWSNATTAVDANPSPSRIKYRPLSWRTTLCRHFLKNRGWCPVGDDECNYIHDLTLADFAKDDVRFSSRRPSTTAANTKQQQNERGKAGPGSKHSHCWAYIQGLCHVPDCQYLHPVAAHMFAAHTPCLAWPNCRRGPLCPYKHPEPYISTSPLVSPVQEPVDLPQSLQPPALALAPPHHHHQPSQLDAVPRGAIPMPYSSTFYYNVPQLQPAPPPFALSAAHPQPPVLFTNPWERWQMQMAYGPPPPPPPPGPIPFTPNFNVNVMNTQRWPSLPAHAHAHAGVFSHPATVGVATAAPGPRPSFDVTLSEPPSGATVQSNYVYPYAYDATDATDVEEPAGTGAGAQRRPHSFSVTTAASPATATGTGAGTGPESDEAFPYVPPQHQHQRPGHAKRVSVVIKSREDLDALALDGDSGNRDSGGGGFRGHARLTHADLLARKSWAPSSSSTLRTAEPTPPPVLYGM